MDKRKDFFEKYILDIISFSKFYHDELLNKVIHYYSNSYHYPVKFDKTNFMHLVGIDYKHGAHKFFDDCYDGQINRSALIFNELNNSFMLKLPVLKYCLYILDEPMYISDQYIIGSAILDGVIIKNRLFMIGLKTINIHTCKPYSLINLQSTMIPKFETVDKIEIFDIQNGTTFVKYQKTV